MRSGLAEVLVEEAHPGQDRPHGREQVVTREAASGT